MKKLAAICALAISASANATDFIVLTNPQYPMMDNTTAIIKSVKTEGYGVVKEICYRGLLFLKHTDLNGTGGLTQVFDPVTGKPVQCQVKEKN